LLVSRAIETSERIQTQVRLSQTDKNINAFEMLKDVKDVLVKWNCTIEGHPTTAYDLEFKCIKCSEFNVTLPIESSRTLKAKDIEKYIDEYYANLKDEYDAIKKIVEGE
jgi:hypothetical protein